VSQLVAGLHQCFTFGSRHTLQRGEQTLLAMTGKWRPEQLQRLWPGVTSEGGGDWPAHLPHHVMLYVDAHDRFPYMLEYRGVDQAGLATAGNGYYPAHDSLATFEFIDVQFAAAMPADIFQFAPPDNSWHDITGRIVEELRPPSPALAPALRPETSTAELTGTRR
jgi:hypothetical protein